MEKYEEIIQRTWTDEALKSKLMSDPKSVFAELGQEIGDDITLEVHDDSSDTMHYVLLDKSQIGSFDLDSDPIIGKITKRAFEDSEFKSKLLSDANSAIQEVLGKEPQGKVMVHENTANHIHLILPTNPNTTGELSDADLSMVAGGKSIMDLLPDGFDLNTFTCGGLGSLFTMGAAALSKVSTGGFLGTLAKLAGPLCLGGVAFSAGASNID